jgi:hypothetical protein
MLPPEAKLSKVAIPPTMLTMAGFWFFSGLRFLLTQFLSILPKELIP